MNKGIFCIYKQNLYFSDIYRTNHVESKVEISFEIIGNSNYEKVGRIRGDTYIKQFKKQISMEDIGVYACINSIPVGYGWVKVKGSKDFFYNTKNNCAYLCRFFVNDKYRGLNIYPCLIKELMRISSEKYEIQKFYISADEENLASIRGITKVGFKLIRKNKFIRFLKVTINKKILNGEQENEII